MNTTDHFFMCQMALIEAQHALLRASRLPDGEHRTVTMGGVRVSLEREIERLKYELSGKPRPAAVAEKSAETPTAGAVDTAEPPVPPVEVLTGQAALEAMFDVREAEQAGEGVSA